MMIDDGWILRNNVIWNKHKGGMNPNKDRFGSVFEDFFFFCSQEKKKKCTNKNLKKIISIRKMAVILLQINQGLNKLNRLGKRPLFTIKKERCV